MIGKKYRKTISVLALLTAFASCRPADYSQLSDEDIQSVKDLVLSSYFMEKPADAAAPRDLNASETLSRATVPVHVIGPVSFASGAVSYDYPEKGQITNYSVASAGTNLYNVTSVTTYPFNAAITDTTEVYYVKDIATTDTALGTWTNDDPVVTPAGDVDNTYRKTFITAYYDKTIRYYDIIDDTSTGNWTGIKYEAFDINGSMTFPDPEFTPAEDGVANWSSKVSYFQVLNKKFSMWGRTYAVIVGTQYYTEHGDAATPTKTFVAYERVVDMGASVKGQSAGNLQKYLWAATSDLNITDSTLATTVIRYQITPDGTKTLRQKTIIYNDYGADFVFGTETGGEPTIAPYAD